MDHPNSVPRLRTLHESCQGPHPSRKIRLLMKMKRIMSKLLGDTGTRNSTPGGWSSVQGLLEQPQSLRLRIRDGTWTA